MKQVDKMTMKEQLELLTKIDRDLKNILSEKRYLHSVSVMKKAKEIAKEYEQDEIVVMLTGLAHDIAKEMSDKEYFEYADKNNISLSEIDKSETISLHGKIGADITAKKYGFTKEMQNAIEFHTTGRSNMSTLDKIIFLADKTENNREGRDIEKLRQIIKEKGLDEAILWDIDYILIPKLIKKQKIIYPETIYARNSIISNINKKC